MVCSGAELTAAEGQLAMRAHCGDQTTAMLCSSGAQGNWRSKVTAGIRQQPCSVAVAVLCSSALRAL
jgi:hypothetical protein